MPPFGRPLAAAFLLLGCTVSHEQDPCAALPPDRLDLRALGGPRPWIFLLAGQSNMSGRGDLADLPPDFGGDPRIALFDNAWHVRVAEEPLDDATCSREPWLDDDAGVGPGLAFGHRLVELDPDARVVLVPCAVGGTPIAWWHPDDTTRRLFSACVDRTRGAVDATGGLVAGVLWYQGESDATADADVAGFTGATEHLFANFRAAFRLPRLPIVTVRLPEESPNPDVFPHWDEIRDLQLGFGELDAVAVVEARGPLAPVRVHLSTAAQLVLGAEMADAWAHLR